MKVMGHRHLYNASPLCDGEADQNWNHMHTDQHYVNLGNVKYLYASFPLVFWFISHLLL